MTTHSPTPRGQSAPGQEGARRGLGEDHEQMNRHPSRRAQTKFLHYWLGLGLGLLPLVPALLALGIFAILRLPNAGDYDPALFLLALVLYGIEMITTIVTLLIKSMRFVGFGLLTMVLISPLVFVLGVVITLKLIPPVSSVIRWR